MRCPGTGETGSGLEMGTVFVAVGPLFGGVAAIDGEVHAGNVAGGVA